MKWLLLGGICCIGLFCSSWAGAAVGEPVQISGKQIWGDTEAKKTFLAGGVRIGQGEMVITAERAEIDLDQKKVHLSERVELIHPEMTISARSLDYDLRKKSGTFKEQVLLKRSAVREQSGQTIKDPIQLSAEQLFFDSETKSFTAQGQCRTEHRDFTGSADQIEYRDATQELIFTGQAYLKRPEGEEVRGEQINLKIKDRSLVVLKQVQIIFQVEDETVFSPGPGKQ